MEQTTVGIEHLLASIAQNSDTAHLTNGRATKASHEAIEGGGAVGQTVAATQQIAA